jgi:hypothetical protein
MSRSLLATLLFLLLATSSDALTRAPQDNAHNEELMHAFACGYSYARSGNNDVCPELKELAERHGFK